jgi:hypothetical protein
MRAWRWSHSAAPTSEGQRRQLIHVGQEADAAQAGDLDAAMPLYGRALR